MPFVRTYDPLDLATLADPYPVLADLRNSTPVFWHEGMRSWTLTRYADCVTVLRDHERFARDRRRTGGSVPEPSLSVQSMDPPDQAPVRSLFMNALRAQDMELIEQRARRNLADRFDMLATRDKFDAIADVAVPLALGVVSDLLGVEEPDIESFAEVSDAIMRSMDAGLDPTTVGPGLIARRKLSRLVDGWFRASDRPGLLSHVREHADEVLGRYVRNTARVMFQGGYSTMLAAVGNVIHTLVRHPQVLDLIRDPATLRLGVDELVRFDGPVQGTSRIATEVCEIGGLTVQAGDIVLVLFVAANHDPAQFPDPCRLLPDRSQGRHLGFGWGTHSCIGTVAAQAALRALISSVQEQSGALRAAGTAQRRRTATMRTFDRLPVTFRP